MQITTRRAQRLDGAMSLLARRGTLGRLHRRLVTAAGADIDRAGYLVLRRIHSEGPTRITELAELMGVEPSTASRHVHSLASQGLLVKRSDPDDRRVAVADITAAGKRLTERVEKERHRILDAALSEWSDRDVDRFVELFEQFAADLSCAVRDTDQ